MSASSSVEAKSEAKTSASSAAAAQESVSQGHREIEIRSMSDVFSPE